MAVPNFVLLRLSLGRSRKEKALVLQTTGFVRLQEMAATLAILQCKDASPLSEFAQFKQNIGKL